MGLGLAGTGTVTGRDEEDPDRAAVLSALEAYSGRGKTRKAFPAPVRFSETRRRQDEPETWLIKNLLDDKQFIGLIGQGKSAKTFTMIHLATSIAANRPAFNDDRFQVERPGPVVMLLREDIEQKAKRRVDSEIRSLGLPPDQEDEVTDRMFIWYSSQESALKLLDDHAFVEFATHCRKIKPVAVMMDPLKKLHNQNENSAEEMEPVMERCLMLREILGCSIILSHHMGKPNETTGKTRSIQLGRGSSAIGDALEGMLAFTDTDDSDAPHSFTNTVTVMAKNGGAVSSFGLRLEIEDDEKGRAIRTTWTVDRAAKSKNKVDEVAEVITNVWRAKNEQAHQRGGESLVMSVNDIRDMVGKRLTDVREAVQTVLAVRGQVREMTVSGGKRWVLVEQTHTAPSKPHAAKAFIPEDK